MQLSKLLGEMAWQLSLGALPRDLSANGMEVCNHDMLHMKLVSHCMLTSWSLNTKLKEKEQEKTQC